MIVDATVITLVTVGVVQAFKGLIPEKWYPLSGVGVGLILGAIAWLISGSSESVYTGLIAGLAANGLYDNIKSVKGLVK